MKILLLLLLLASCTTNQPVKRLVPEPKKPITRESEKPYKVFFPSNSTKDIEWIQKLSKTANCVLNRGHFRHLVHEAPSFDYTEDNGKQVFSKLTSARCELNLQKTKWPWSSAIAWYKNGKVYFNSRKLNRSLKSMVNSFFHECLHLVGYSHGDNYSKNKEDAVNYRVGKLAENYTNKCAQ